MYILLLMLLWKHPLCSITAITTLFATLFLFSAPLAQAEKPIPDAPYYYVLDEAKILSTQETYALQTLLIKHDHASGQQFMIAVFDSLDGEELHDYTTRVFQSWKIGQRGKNDGLLLALYWKDKKARLEVGYGLETLLPEIKARQILEEILIPELKAEKPGKGLALTSLEVLKTVESPLIQNEDAQKIIAGGGFSTALPTLSDEASIGIAVGALMLGFSLFLLFTFRFINAEVHFSRDGVFRPGLWDILPKKKVRGFEKFSGGGSSDNW